MSCIQKVNCDRDALKQECCLVPIASSGTQPRTHLREKIQSEMSFKRDWYEKAGETTIFILLP